MLLEVGETKLRSIAVKGEGDWVNGPKRQWRGAAKGEKPLIALIMCEVGDALIWTKSERHGPQGELTINMLISHYDADGCRVQVNYGLGGIHARANTTVASAEYRPELPASFEVKTAEINKLASVKGEPDMDFYALFLCADEAEFSESGSWTVKQSYVDGLQEPFRSILVGGRFGELDMSADPEEWVTEPQTS